MYSPDLIVGQVSSPPDHLSHYQHFSQVIQSNPIQSILINPLSHQLSARQWDRQGLQQLFSFSLQLWFHANRLPPFFERKILLDSFFEPSTRTRFSFESAWVRLGGKILSMTSPEMGAVSKGESWEDTMAMFNNYGNVLVIRHPNADVVFRMVRQATIPVINAGNGEEEHPTQALTDLFTLAVWKPELFGFGDASAYPIKLGILGSPRRMRAVRSFLLLLTNYSTAFDEIWVLGTDSRALFAEGQKEELEQGGLTIHCVDPWKADLSALDAIYLNSLIWKDNRAENWLEKTSLNTESPLKPDCVILHPLARGPELDTSLDSTKHNWYFAQAQNAVFVRMALLLGCMGRAQEAWEIVRP